MKLHILLLIVFSFIIIFLYHNLFQTFYQQDEWNTLGHIQAEGIKAFLRGQTFFEVFAGSGRPLSYPIHYVMYTYFPFSIAPYILFTLIFHITNTFLVFLLSKKLTQNFLVSFLAAMYFATASTSHQAITWIAATTTTLPSVTFIILSLLRYLSFIKTRKKSSLFLVIVFVVIAFYFKESSIFVFILFPLLSYLYSKKKTGREILKENTIILLIAGIFILFRIMSLFVFNHGLTTGFVTRNEDPVFKLLLHIFTYPISSFSQLYIYPRFMWNASELFVNLNYPRIDGTDFSIVVVETIAAEFLSILVSLLFLGVSFLLLKQKKYRASVIFSLFFTITSFLPYVVLDKSTAYLESRYFYPGQVGAAMLFGIFIYSVWNYFKNRFMKLQFFNLVICILVLVYFILQIRVIQKEIDILVTLSKERMFVINSLKSLYPHASENNVFYMTGNQDYFASNHKMPFAQGMGFTLMTLYYKDGIVPASFLRDDILWNMTEQGYVRMGNKSFGYYSEMAKLAEDVKKYHLSLNQIKAFYYDAPNKKLRDITPHVKKDIEASLSAQLHAE